MTCNFIFRRSSHFSSSHAPYSKFCRGKSGMSWNQTPPSPRKPKTQQQSWDAARTPTINLYNPTREFCESSPNMPMASASLSNQTIKKSPTSQTRKINYNRYCLPNPMHQMSDPGTYYNMTPSQKSPKSPSGQAFEFEIELSVTPQQGRSPLKSAGSNRRCYEDTSTSELTPAALTSPKNYTFGAVSPKFDNIGMNVRDLCRGSSQAFRI